MYPTVTFDYDSGVYTFTLWRDDKEVIHKLKGLNVYLEVEDTSDGDLYYIYVKTYDNEDILISLTKDEYDVLDPIILDIEDKICDKFFQEDRKCNFCGTMESECGGDHVDEMRDIQRKALRYD